MKNSCVLDASALLILINGERGEEKIVKYLPHACMSAVNISEVAATLQLIDMPKQQIESLINSLVSTIIPFDEHQAYETAELRKSTKEAGLSLGDRVCLALGGIKKLPVVTADKIWKKVNIGVEIILAR